MPARARERKRQAGASECAHGVAGKVRKARDSPGLVELGELDRVGERRRDEGRRHDGESAAESRRDEPGEAGAEREVEQDVCGDVASRHAGLRQLAGPREGGHAIQ